MKLNITVEITPEELLKLLDSPDRRPIVTFPKK